MEEGMQLLRVTDIAYRMGVTSGRIYQLIAAGTIPAIRIGGSIRIPRDAWENWLREAGAAAMAAVGKKLAPGGPQGTDDRGGRG